MDNLTISLSGKLVEEYRIYAREAGMTLEAVMNEALDDWMEKEGHPKLSKGESRASEPSHGFLAVEYSS